MNAYEVSRAVDSVSPQGWLVQSVGGHLRLLSQLQVREGENYDPNQIYGDKQ